MRRNPPAKWVLPDTVDPVGRKCIEIQVPDDPAHIAAFRGALLALASAYNWGDDPTHKAKDVALVWREIIDNMTEWGCTLQTQIRVDDICTLSWSYDDWVTFASYDPSACITALIDSIVPGMISDGIIDAINSGQIQGGTGQQSPQEPPDVGECRTYHARLRPGEKWLCPSPIHAGDIVHILDQRGGWSIGELAWYCPDGSRYLLGACDSALHSHVTGDLLNPGAWHMALIGLIGSTYFDPLTSAYTVPGGVAGSDLYIVANTNLTGVPSGEAEFDLQVCSGNYWVHTFDFTLNNGSWQVRTESSNNPRAVYTAGVGWTQGAGGYCQIERFFTETTLVQVDVYEATNPDSGRAAMNLYRVGGAVRTLTQNTYDVVGGLYHRVYAFADTNCDEIWVSGDRAAGGCTKVKIVITGKGSDPF